MSLYDVWLAEQYTASTSLPIPEGEEATPFDPADYPFTVMEVVRYYNG